MWKGEIDREGQIKRIYIYIKREREREGEKRLSADAGVNNPDFFLMLNI